MADILAFDTAPIFLLAYGQTPAAAVTPPVIPITPPGVPSSPPVNPLAKNAGVTLDSLIMCGDGYRRFSYLSYYASAVPSAFYQTYKGYRTNRLDYQHLRAKGSQSIVEIRTNKGFIRISPESTILCGRNFVEASGVATFSETRKTVKDVVVGDSLLFSYGNYSGSQFASMENPTVIPPPDEMVYGCPFTAPTVDNDILWLFGYLADQTPIRSFIDTDGNEIFPIVAPTSVESRINAQLAKFGADSLVRVDATFCKFLNSSFPVYWNILHRYYSALDTLGYYSPALALSRTMSSKLAYFAGAWDYSYIILADEYAYMRTAKQRLASDLCSLASNVNIMLTMTKNTDGSYTLVSDTDYRRYNYDKLNPYSSISRSVPSVVTGLLEQYLGATVEEISGYNPSFILNIEYPFLNQPFVVNGFCIL